jgi:hypothetical protein
MDAIYSNLELHLTPFSLHAELFLIAGRSLILRSRQFSPNGKAIQILAIGRQTNPYGEGVAVWIRVHSRSERLRCRGRSVGDAWRLAPPKLEWLDAQFIIHLFKSGFLEAHDIWKHMKA